MFALTQNTSRQKEIAEVVFRNGWDYMRGLMTGGKSDEPRLPSPTVLRNILIELGPVYVKLGQLLSTRPDILPGKYVDALTDLQARVPAVAWLEVESLIRQELGKPIEEVFSSIDRQAIAAGSIGQVHRATLKDGQSVALKIQRPGIDVVVEQDISLIKNLAELVALTDFGKDFDIVALAEEFTSALRAELDFTSEARYTEQLNRNLDNSRWFDPKKVIVPQVYWKITTSKLLTSDYDRMLRKYFNLSISEINFSEVFYEVLQVSRDNKIRLPSGTLTKN